MKKSNSFNYEHPSNSKPNLNRSLNQLSSGLSEDFPQSQEKSSQQKSLNSLKLDAANTRFRSFSATSSVPQGQNEALSTSKGDLSDTGGGGGGDCIKLIKLKGGHLKDNSAFAQLLLIQDLSNDFGDVPPSINLLDSPSRSNSNLKRSSSLQSFTGQEEASNSAVWILRFSTDGCYLAAGRQDGNIVVWEYLPSSSFYESQHSIPPLTYNQTDSPINESGRSTPDPTMPDKTSRSIFNPEPLQIYKGHTMAVSDLSWSSAGFLVSGSIDGTARLWHISHSSCLCVFQHTDFVSCVRFHPFDDNFFATGSFDGRVRVWDIRHKKLVYWNEIQKDSITAISFTKDASTVIVGTLSGTVVFYEFAGLKYNTQINITSGKGLRAKDAKITGIEVMPNTSLAEEKVLITSADSKVRLFNVKDKSLHRTYKGFDMKFGRGAASFSTDGEYILATSDDRQLAIWDKSPPDGNQQYSGVLSSVIHRHIDTAKATGQERFIASDHPITWALLVPTNPNKTPGSAMSGTSSPPSTMAIVVANDHGRILVYG